MFPLCVNLLGTETLRIEDGGVKKKKDLAFLGVIRSPNSIVHIFSRRIYYYNCGVRYEIRERAENLLCVKNILISVYLFLQIMNIEMMYQYHLCIVRFVFK